MLSKKRSRPSSTRRATALSVLLLTAALAANAQATLEADINQGPGSSDPVYLTEYDGKLYFRASNGINGGELWSYDGSNATMEADIAPGSDGGGPTDLTEYDGKLYFGASEGINGYELWSYDGTTATMEAEIWPGSINSLPRYLAVYGDRLYFQADEGEEQRNKRRENT